MPSEHARLSPSASGRWISCPASIQMGEQHALPDRGSKYAQEGTLAHELGEIEVLRTFGLIEPDQYAARLSDWREEMFAEGYTKDTITEMSAHVEDYVELVVSRAKLRPHSMVMVEERLSTGVPSSWGTSDIVIVSPTHVEIIDLKYGAGIKVSAYRNSQLRLYAAGALDAYGDLLGPIDTVRMTVFQPRLDHVDTEELTPQELRFWREEIVLPAAYEALGPNPRFGPSESACRFCPAAGVCRARMEKATQEDFGRKPDELSLEEISALLGRTGEIKAWASAVENYALDAAYSHGEPIPRWKVVRSGGRRVIKDQTAAIQLLIDQGHPAEQVADFKTKSLGTLEKVVGKKELEDALGDLIHRSEGKPSLVPEYDKRPAIDPAASAVEDFS